MPRRLGGGGPAIAGPLLAAAVALGAGSAAQLVAASLSLPEPATGVSLGCDLGPSRRIELERGRLSEAAGRSSDSPDRMSAVRRDRAAPRPLFGDAVDHRRVAGRRGSPAELSGSSDACGGDVDGLPAGGGLPDRALTAFRASGPGLDRATPRAGPPLHRLAPKTSPPRQPIA